MGNEGTATILSHSIASLWLAVFICLLINEQRCQFLLGQEAGSTDNSSLQCMARGTCNSKSLSFNLFLAIFLYDTPSSPFGKV